MKRSMLGAISGAVMMAALVAGQSWGQGTPAIDPAKSGQTPVSPVVGSVEAAGSVPDVQVVVGPGVRGWQVALVYPKAVGKKSVSDDVASVARVTGSPAMGLKVETRRLERADPKRGGQAPIMTSATFDTKANLVDYPAGRVAVEGIVTALQHHGRIAAVFLIPGKFSWNGATRYEDTHLRVDASVGEGALVFVANIRSRPIDGFRMPDPSPLPVDQQNAPSRASRRVLNPTALGWLLAPVVGLFVFALVRGWTRR